MDRAAEHPLTLVAAGPGAGKTVLLASWLATHPELTPAWLSCDSWDSEASRFWTSILAALGSIVPEAGREASDLLREGEALDEVVASLINDLTLTTSPLHLVIDDLHVVPPDALEGFATLIERLPSHVHVVVATRVDPVLPLHRWRVHGVLSELRAGDLRMNETETRAVVERLGLDLTSGELRLLTDRVEGWVAGIHLAALSLRNADDQVSFFERLSRVQQTIGDFLVAEVLVHQPSHIVRFLEATSVVDEFDVQMVRALLGQNDVTAMLREAVTSFFVLPLGGDPARYRYHQLFRDLLRAELVADDPKWALDLHERAATEYTRRGDYAMAVDHFLLAGNMDEAFEMLHQTVAQIWFTRSGSDLGDLIDHLPDDNLTGRAERMIDVALALGMLGRVAECERWIRRVQVVTAEGVKDPVVGARMVGVEALYGFLQGDPEPALAFERDVVPHVPPGDDPVLDLSALMLGRAHIFADDPEGAIAVCETALSRIADPQIEGIVTGIQAWALLERGDVVAARRLAEASLASARRSDAIEHVGMFDALLTLASTALEADQFDEAEVYLDDSFRRCEGVRPSWEAVALVEQARQCRARTDYMDALDVLERARSVLSPTVASPLRSWVDECEARVRLDLGDIEGARTAVRRLPPSPRRLVVEAMVALSEGDLSSMRHLLDRLDSEKLVPRWQLERHLLMARLQAVTGGDPAPVLALALGTARRQGFVRSVVTGLPGMTMALRDTLVRLPADDATDALLLAVDRVHVRQPALAVSPGLLSDRERGVLRYLPTRLTTREIASEMYISMNTLKTHLKSIYRKLDASSRSEAVARAKVLGCL